MKRRAFIAGLGSAAAWPMMARAQGHTRPIVGLLFPISDEASRPNLTALRSKLIGLGFIEGRDYDLAIRNAPIPDRNTGLTVGGELLALSPAVLVVGAVPSVVLAIHELTSTVPVVMVNLSQDPVALGLAASVAHPGGNFTGFMIWSDPAIVGKQLALLKELVPSIIRVNAVLNAGDAATQSLLPDFGHNLNLTIRTFSATRREDVLAILAETEGKADGLFFGASPVFNTMRHELAGLVARTGLPAVYHDLMIAPVGGLMAYGSNIPKNYGAAAEYVAKILSGEKPGNLPIQQPIFYDLVINLKTAKALGLTVPSSLLARADEVIE
jgi:putative tryptophan/tyrosine transport system substrate-binding protein